MAVSFLSGFNLTRTTIRLCGKFFKYTRQMVARCMSLHVVCYYAVAALHPQMTWLDPPWIRPAYCFVSVIVWTESKNVTISDRFICVILTVKQSAALAACVLRATNPVTWLEDFLTSKWPGSFTALHLMTCLTTLVTGNDLAALTAWRRHCYHACIIRSFWCCFYTVFQKKWRQNRNHNSYDKCYQN